MKHLALKKTLALVLVLASLLTLFSVSALAQEAVVLNYYTKADPTGIVAEICSRFEAAHPGVTINRIDLPEGSDKTLQVISTVLQAKDSSMDLYDSDVTWPPMLAAAGWAEPLDAYVTDEEKAVFFQGALSANTVNGQLYSLPVRIDTTVLLYRSDLLEKYGFAPPTTWDEVFAISKEIMAKEEGMIGFGASWNQSEQLTSSLLEFIWAYGGRVTDEEGNVVFDSPETIRGIKAMYDMIWTDKITAEGILGFASSDARAPFYSGNQIFLRDWSVGVSSARNPEKSSVHDKFGFSSLPLGDQERSYSCLGGWQIVVSGYSKHKEEAAAFAKFLTSYESERDSAIAAGFLPSRMDVYDDEKLKQENPAIIEMLSPAMAASARPKSSYYVEISSILQVGGQNMLTGNVSIEDGVKDIHQQISEVLSR